MNNLRRILARKVKYSLLNKYPAAQWLWMLRRVDLQFVSDGDLASTAMEVIRIAENLTGESTQTKFRRRASGSLLSFDITDTMMSDLARVLLISGEFKTLYSWQRRVVKGQSIQVCDDDIPSLVPNSVIDTALHLLDFRSMDGPLNVWHPMLRRIPTEDEAAKSTKGNTIFVASRAVPAGQGKPEAKKTLELNFQKTLNFKLMLLYVSPHYDGASLSASIGRDEATKVAALVILGSALTRFNLTPGMPKDPHAGMARGWIIFNSTLEEWLAANFDDICSPEIWPNYLQDVVPQKSSDIMPLVLGLYDFGGISAPGPLVRRLEGGDIIIDLYALSEELIQRFRFGISSGGETVNGPADRFELDVQNVIDMSIFAPDSKVRQMRGKSLLDLGRPITDLDAIAVLGNTLIGIDCKNYPTLREYDAGDFRTVRNAASKVKDACSRWAEKMKYLQSHRVGQNYDLSSFDNIVGVVVTPSLMYTGEPSCEEVVFSDESSGVEIRRYMSATELMIAFGMTGPHVDGQWSRGL
ncbi:hypothetical protein RCG67_05520 [Kocuria sp. CPCC 205292]|uniref:hypothetical protein n=1 Tax=Kocuria cellulosilytica TaxID=3071451 RepID=UPI0034D3E665